MPNIIDILARALSLRQETALSSITPNRAGGIMYDTLLVLNQMQLEGGALLISKVYASVSAMEADTTPTSDLTGRALKPGQLVVIVTSDASSSDMGSEYRYNGPGSWTYVGKVGGLPLDTVPTQSSTKGITSGGVYAALSAMKAEGYKYMGIASPGSGGTTPGTPNQPVFYIAGPGSYPNFGSITVASGYIGFIKYSSGSWTVESVAVGGNYDEQISQLEAETGTPFTPELVIERGAISSQDGTNTSANNRIRTNNFIVADGIGITTSGNKVYAFGYKSDGAYVGSSNAWISTNKDVYINGADKYRLGFAYSDDGQIGPSDFSSLGVSILALRRSDFLKVVAQDLSETQKETARANIGAIPESVVLNNALHLVGAGETAISVDFTLLPNSKYKMAISNPSWGYSGTSIKLSLKPTGGSAIFTYVGQNEVPSEIYFSTGNSDKYTLTIRANDGVSFEYFFEELNDISTGIVMGVKPYLSFVKRETGWDVTVNSSTKILKNWDSLSVSPSGTFSFTDTDKLLVYRASTNTLELIGTANKRTDTVLLDYRASSKMFVGGLFYPYVISRRISDYDKYVTPFDFEFSEYGVVSWSSLSIRKGNGDILTFEAGAYIVDSSNWLILREQTGTLALTSRSLLKTTEMILLGVQEATYIGPLADYIEQQKLTSWYGDEYELDVKRNGEQLKNVKWTPKADVRTNEGLNPAGVDVTGIPYSSVKELEKFIGVDVSLHTFMTAVNNIHSLFYTEKVGGGNSQSAYGKVYYGVNCSSYYGSVCSAFVDACLSLKVRYDSWSYRTSPKTFHILEPQDEQSLRVGDVISEDGHGAIITRIYRDLSGRITYVEVSEHNAPLATTKYGVYYLERLRAASNGVYCRRNNLGLVKYEPSPFVLADGEPLYRKGDLVFVDSTIDRSFYLCETPNRNAAWGDNYWSKIAVFATGSQINMGGYRQYGERLYRCKVTHTPTEFVPANWQYIPGVKEWTPYPYVYNDDIVTFAGDRAAFALGDDIYINFNKGSYTSMQIYNEGTLVDTITLGDGYQVDVSSICNTPGLYKARLTDGVNYSRYTYFEVIDATATASMASGIVTINYSSVYGKPLGAQIVELSGYPVCRFELDGGSSITIDPQAGFYRESWPYYKRSGDYPKTIYARVVVAGEYGNVVSPMVELGEISAITGTLIYPDKPIDLGILSGANNLILADGTQGKRYDFSFTAGAGLSISLRRTEGKMRWMGEQPTMVEGKTYFFSVVNGAVTWQVAD